MRWVLPFLAVWCFANSAHAALDPASASVDIKLDVTDSMGFHPEWDAHSDVTGTDTMPIYASVSQDVTSPYINGTPPSVGVYEMIAAAEVVAGPGVGAASVRASSTHISGTLRGDNPRITASATVSYYAGVAARQPSPLLFRPPIFVSVTGHGSVSATHDSTIGFSSASVIIAVSGGNIPGTYRQSKSVQARVGNGSLPSMNEDLDFSLRVRLDDEFSLLNISKGVLGEIRTGASFSSHEFQAAVDPVLSFDQAAFDAYALEQGFPSFPLEEYFAFEFSAGIPLVPEPASAAGVILGSALPLRRRRLSR